MDLPTIQRLTPPIRVSIHIGECQLIAYSGSIAGHICVLDGGGDKSLVATVKVLNDSDPSRCRSGPPARRRTVLGLLPISGLVGRQRRDSGSVIGFAIKVPTDRSYR